MTSTLSTPVGRTRAPAPRAAGLGPFEFIPHLVAGMVTLAIYLLLPPSAGLSALSLTACVYSVTLALTRGGPYLIPSGVFFMAAGVFIGGGAYYLGRVETVASVEQVRNGATLALLSTVGVAMVTSLCSVQWRLRWADDRFDHDPHSPDFNRPRQWELRAVILMVLSQAPPVQSALGALATGMGFAGVLMVSLAAASRRLRMRWPGDLAIVAMAGLVPAIWVSLEFQGGGRIAVAGLFVAAFTGWNLVRPHPIQKVVLILSIPVFLFFAGQSRLGGDDGSSTSSVVADGNGLGSVYSPLETWADVIKPKPVDKQQLMGPRYGETFFNTLVLPVPRGLWPDKPDGFGRELVDSLEVKGVSEEHSAAGLIQSEWYANFGYWGLIWMAPVIGVLLAVLDRLHARLAASRLRTPSQWWAAIAMMCCVASLADLFWVGSFTWFSRGGLAALVAALLARLSLGRQRRLPYRPEVPPSGPPPAGAEAKVGRAAHALG